MIAILTPWNWTEIIESIIVSLVFIAVPVVWRIEHHHRKHAERLDRIEKHLGVEPPRSLSSDTDN